MCLYVTYLVSYCILDFFFFWLGRKKTKSPKQMKNNIPILEKQMIDYLLISTEIQVILLQSASGRSNKEGERCTLGKTSEKSKEILQTGSNRVRREIQRKRKVNYKEPKEKKTRSQETDPIVKAERDKDFIWRWRKK